MTNTERIKRLAEWMGWHQSESLYGDPVWLDSECQLRAYQDDWNPITRIQDAWIILEKMQTMTLKQRSKFKKHLREGLCGSDWWMVGKDQLCNSICKACEKLMEAK